MTSKYWVRLFVTTLFLGGLTSGVLGFFFRWDEFSTHFVNVEVSEIITAFLWLVGVGFIFSVISQMGFFSYLTIHRFGLGIFKGPSLWNGVQWVIIAVALFDLVYLRYNAFAEDGEGVGPYVIFAAVFTLICVMIALVKRQQAKHTFTSAFFFMVVATLVEALPAFRSNEMSYVYLMVSTLIICNGYQLLRLPHYIELSKKATQERMDRKAAQA